MSNGNSGPAFTLRDIKDLLRNELGPVRARVDNLDGSLDAMRRQMAQEISRLENEMNELAKLIVKAIDRQTEMVVHGLDRQTDSVTGGIDRQTIAVVGGVAATTLMIERTKSQIEADFQQTRGRIELQTESTLQIEVGKKISDISALRSKLMSFAQDIKTRYDKSLEGVAINRDLYDDNFRKIHDEYENKIRTIGDHILRIKEEDIAPAETAARVPYEAAHSLPIELDLERLQLRSQSLDETLAMLKSSRLDDVLGALDGVHGVLDAHAVGPQPAGAGAQLLVEGLMVSSSIQTQLVVGCRAAMDAGSDHPVIEANENSLQVFSSSVNAQRFQTLAGQRKRRVASKQELIDLTEAAAAMRQGNRISEESLSLLKDFLSAGKLMKLEA